MSTSLAASKGRLLCNADKPTRSRQQWWHQQLAQWLAMMPQCLQAQKLAARMSPNHACFAPRQHPHATPRQKISESCESHSQHEEGDSPAARSQASAVATATPAKSSSPQITDGTPPVPAQAPADAVVAEPPQSSRSQRSSATTSAAGCAAPPKPPSPRHHVAPTERQPSPAMLDSGMVDMLEIAEQLRRTLGMPPAASAGLKDFLLDAIDPSHAASSCCWCQQQLILRASQRH